MAIVLPSVTELLDALDRSHLLDQSRSDQLREGVSPRFSDPEALGQELIRLGWLTSYQLEQIAAGRGEELVLGQYVVLDLLGEGGMGQVFKARHRRLDRIDALKVIRPRFADQPEVLRRFLREARAAARLHHPHRQHLRRRRGARHPLPGDGVRRGD
jgi:serine/threonine protein kinase